MKVASDPKAFPAPINPSIGSRMVTRNQARLNELESRLKASPLSKISSNRLVTTDMVALEASNPVEATASTPYQPTAPSSDASDESMTPVPAHKVGCMTLVSSPISSPITSPAPSPRRRLEAHIVVSVPLTLLAPDRPPDFLKMVEAQFTAIQLTLQCPWCHKNGGFRVDERRDDKYLIIKCGTKTLAGGVCNKKFNCVGVLAQWFPDAEFAKYVRTKYLPKTDKAPDGAPAKRETNVNGHAYTGIPSFEHFAISDDVEDAISRLLEYTESLERRYAFEKEAYADRVEELETELRKARNSEIRLAKEVHYLETELDRVAKGQARQEFQRLNATPFSTILSKGQEMVEASPSDNSPSARTAPHVIRYSTDKGKELLFDPVVSDPSKGIPIPSSKSVPPSREESNNKPMAKAPPSREESNNKSTSKVKSISAPARKQEPDRKPMPTGKSVQVGKPESPREKKYPIQSSKKAEPTTHGKERSPSKSAPTNAEISKILQAKPKDAQSPLCSVVVHGLQACKLGLLRRVLSSPQVGIDAKMLFGIEVISQSLLEFHIPVDYKDTFRKCLLAQRPDLKLLGEALDPRHQDGTAKEIAEDTVWRLERRIASTGDANYRAFLRRYIEQGRRQLATGNFSKFDTKGSSQSSSSPAKSAASTTAVRQTPAKPKGRKPSRH